MRGCTSEIQLNIYLTKTELLAGHGSSFSMNLGGDTSANAKSTTHQMSAIPATSMIPAILFISEDGFRDDYPTGKGLTASFICTYSL
jgi:hypothetical protein